MLDTATADKMPTEVSFICQFFTGAGCKVWATELWECGTNSDCVISVGYEGEACMLSTYCRWFVAAIVWTDVVTWRDYSGTPGISSDPDTRRQDRKAELYDFRKGLTALAQTLFAWRSTCSGLHEVATERAITAPSPRHDSRSAPLLSDVLKDLQYPAVQRRSAGSGGALVRP